VVDDGDDDDGRVLRAGEASRKNKFEFMTTLLPSTLKLVNLYEGVQL